MSKICIISVDHSPLDDRIFYKEALSLKKNGFDVTMVFSAEPDGSVYDMGGNKKLNHNNEAHMEFEGIPCSFIPRPKGLIQKWLNKVFLSSYFKQFIQTAANENADVYHAHEPVSYYIGLQVQKINGAKVIFDSHESWEGGTPKDKVVKWLYAKDLKYLITANQITRGSMLIKNRYLKTEIIYNYPHPEIFPGGFNETKLDNPVIVHDGYLPFNRGLKEMIEVVQLLKPKFPKIKFRILGETKGAEREYLQQKTNEYNLEENIEETGWVDYLEVGNHLQDCSIGLILKTDTPNNILGGPAIKLFNYFAYGIAVVDIDLPESTRFLNKTNSGISVQIRNPKNIAEAIELLLNNKQLLKKYCQNSHAAYAKCNWKSEEIKLINFYKNEVLNNKGLIVR